MLKRARRRELRSPFLRWLFSTCVSELSSQGRAKCGNESEAIHHPRSKYEVSHVIRTWQKVSERVLCRSDKWLLVSEVCRLASRANDWCRDTDGWMDRQQIVSDTALRDRVHADRWNSGSSQGTPRWRGVMRATDGERNKCSCKEWKQRMEQTTRMHACGFFCFIYLKLPLLVAYLMWLQM